MKHRVDKDDEDDDRNDPDSLDQGSDKYSRNSDGYLPHYHPSVAKESVRPSEYTSLSVPCLQNYSTSNANISQSQTEGENNIDEERIIQAFLLTNKKCKKQLEDFKATLSNCSVSESVNNREVHTITKTSCISNNMTVTVSSQEDVAQGKIPEDDQEQALVENSRDVSQAMPPQRGANKHERKPEDSFAYGNFCVGQPKNLPSSSTALNMSVLKTLQVNKSLVADRLHFKKIACSKAVQYALFQCGTVTRSLNECQALIKLNDARSCYFELQSEKPQPLPVLVVDYFPTSLENLINRLAITLDAIRYTVLSDVALGLNYLHNGSTCIVHKNLSAKNVLISTCSLQAKIVDFDIDVNSTAQTQCSESLTTDCTSAVDTSSDIFSFGVLMIQMFIEQPYLNGQAAASVWLQYRQYLESIGYFDPLLSQLIHSCITHDPQSKVKAVDIAHQLTHLAQWFPVSSTHKKQWLSVLQTPVEPPPGSLSLTFPSQYDDEECSSFDTSDHSTTPQVDNIIPAPSLPIDEKVCICTSESRILKAVKQNKANLIMLSLSISTNSITVQRYMHTLAFLSALLPRHVPLVPYAFLNQIRIVANHIAKLVKVASQLFRALDNVHTLSKYVEVSGFLDLPTDFPHCVQNKSLVYT